MSNRFSRLRQLVRRPKVCTSKPVEAPVPEPPDLPCTNNFLLPPDVGIFENQTLEWQYQICLEGIPEGDPLTLEILSDTGNTIEFIGGDDTTNGSEVTLSYAADTMAGGDNLQIVISHDGEIVHTIEQLVSIFFSSPPDD